MVLKHRLLTAVLGIPLLISLIYFGSIPLFLAVLLVFFLGLKEFIHMVENAGYFPLKMSMYIGGFLLIGESYLYKGEHGILAFFIVFMLLIINLVLLNKISLATMAVSLLGVVYLSFLKYILLLRDLPNGFLLIFMAFLLTWMVDTGAYFSGRFFGHKKLAPSISPNKTQEGAIGGIIITILTAVVLHFTLIPIGVFNAVILGFLISILGQLGDLFESFIKRSANVKDSGNLLPGHGGVLDRFDSILFTVPITYYFIYLL